MKTKKIDVYFKGVYQHSTILRKTCKAAKESALKTWKSLASDDNPNGYSATMIARFEIMSRHPELVKAFFDKDYIK